MLYLPGPTPPLPSLSFLSPPQDLRRQGAQYAQSNDLGDVEDIRAFEIGVVLLWGALDSCNPQSSNADYALSTVREEGV